ncbi:MAG: hypothetical protein ACRC6V_01365, partial [Bacteroidales bacterium]
MSILMRRREMMDMSIVNDSIHGIRWVQSDNNDMVEFVGNEWHNQLKPIQSSMRPCEARHDWSDFAYLQDDVTLRV